LPKLKGGAEITPPAHARQRGDALVRLAVVVARFAAV
jgi:hypothetical protein